MRYVPVITIALAGVVHLLIAPLHYAHAPAHGLFFALAGLAQVVWAVAFWYRPSLLLYRMGLSLSGGLIILWLLTQTMGAPFGHGSEPVDASAVVCKACELIGLISLVALAWAGPIAIAPASLSRRVGEAAALSLIVGFGFFGLGQVVDPWFLQWGEQPTLTGEHGHAGSEHSHDEEHSHGEEVSP